jgi:carbon starvation protein
MSRVVFNDRLDAALCALFMGVVISVLVYSVKAIMAARRNGKATTQETAFTPLPAGQHA